MSPFSFSADIPVKHSIAAGDVQFAFSADGTLVRGCCRCLLTIFPYRKFLRVAGAKHSLNPSNVLPYCNSAAAAVLYQKQSHTCQKRFFLSLLR